MSKFSPFCQYLVLFFFLFKQSVFLLCINYVNEQRKTWHICFCDCVTVTWGLQEVFVLIMGPRELWTLGMSDVSSSSWSAARVLTPADQKQCSHRSWSCRPAPAGSCDTTSLWSTNGTDIITSRSRTLNPTLDKQWTRCHDQQHTEL